MRRVADLTPEQQERIAPYLGAADGRPDFGPAEDWRADEPSNPCPGCGGKEATLLGTLGRRTHLRCRDCGLDRSYLSPDDDPSL